jgi:type II secretory pathway pseudopilin PulG
LLIVVAIIAILAAIAIPNLLEAQMRAKVSAAKTNMRTIAGALEAFRIDRNLYPPNVARSTGDYVHYIANIEDPLWSLGDIPEGFPPATLTTPIAYITTPPEDPFLGGRLDRYACAWQYGTDSSSRNAWALESVGPNLGGKWASSNRGRDLDKPYAGSNQLESFRTLYDAYGLQTTRLLFLVGTGTEGDPGSYDPSNGTVSAGDVVRFSSGEP